MPLTSPVTTVTTAATTKTHMRVLPRSPEGLETLFREHHEMVFRTAYRITGSTTDAEDVLQIIFLRLAKRTSDYDFAPSPGGYLHRAAINAALDLVRSRHAGAQSVPLEDAAFELMQNQATSPETEHAERELRGIVQQAVARLGGKTSEMFVLRYFEGYDNREIAELLGTSQTVVAVMLHRARTRLRKEIKKFVEI